MKQNILIGTFATLFATTGAAITPTAGYPRCKSVVTNENWKPLRVNCNATDLLCFSEYWRYDLKIAAGEKCYLGPEDFGRFIIKLETPACKNVEYTMKYTSAAFPTNKDRFNIGSTACSLPVAAVTSGNEITPGTTDVPMWDGETYDFSATCDAVVYVDMPATINVAECTTFTVWGNAGAQYVQALGLATAAMLSYTLY